MISHGICRNDNLLTFEYSPDYEQSRMSYFQVLNTFSRQLELLGFCPIDQGTHSIPWIPAALGALTLTKQWLAYIFLDPWSLDVIFPKIVGMEHLSCRDIGTAFLQRKSCNNFLNYTNFSCMIFYAKMLWYSRHTYCLQEDSTCFGLKVSA